MASQIDRTGAFRGYITEHGVGATKNGFPQFTGRFTATQRWVEAKEEMTAFGIDTPQWVDWSGYEQDMVGYLVLFGKDKNTQELKPLFHLENLQKATGWDGSSFSALSGLDLSQKLVTFWVDENEYEGNVTLRINAIDDGEAAAIRTLRVLDGDGLKDLDARFGNMLAGKKTAAAAKPVSAPAKTTTAAGKPATPPKPGAPSATAKPAATTPAAVKPVAPSKPTAAAPTASKPAAKLPPKPPAAKPIAETEGDNDHPSEAASGMTMDAAWAHVMANKGTASDDDCAEKWIDASGAMAPGKEEADITAEEWAKIATATLTALKG